jgi:phosphatidylglycerophosphatase A
MTRPELKRRTIFSRAAVVIATLGGVGYARYAPGTAGALAAAIVLYPAHPDPWMSAAILAVLGIAAVWSAGLAASRLGSRDPACVVVDEAFGMALVMAICPAPMGAQGLRSILAGFALFRILDVVKPPPLRDLERLPGGWGIVADDAGAALYTILLLKLLKLA